MADTYTPRLKQAYEDRIVKARFRSGETGDCVCPPGLPCVCGAVRTVRLVRRVPKTPVPDEIAGNRRAASARLRVAERIADDQPQQQHQNENENEKDG